TIDVYRGKFLPTNNFIAFASFISFFPQLVAGPIERASSLLPQLLKKRNFSFDESITGLRLLIWGLFKKIIIADSLAPIVDNIFDNYQDLAGGTLWLGLIYFSFQIYCDFSGYSDIAIGTARLLGIKIMNNFEFPFFSRNVAEFWRRWHISLTSWFTDYFYFPLKLEYRNSGPFANLFILLLYFGLIGLWHGSNWTFILFGIYHGLFFIPTIFYPKFYSLKSKNISENSALPTFKELFQVFFTFLIVSLGWVFFRSEDVWSAYVYFISLFNDVFPDMYRSFFVFLVIPFIFIEYLYFKKEAYLLTTKNILFRTIESILLYYLLYKMAFENTLQQFIYFQF
ncbi:MBOAT family protein, partial [Flavobacteriaceae bacterium]|nr:MBOAT family protein [Flavobacteriaceae bacterium]